MAKNNTIDRLQGLFESHEVEVLATLRRWDLDPSDLGEELGRLADEIDEADQDAEAAFVAWLAA